MKIIYKRCRICLTWFRPQAHHNHCDYCGARDMGIVEDKRLVLNKDGVELVRANGIPFEQLINAR